MASEFAKAVGRALAAVDATREAYTFASNALAASGNLVDALVHIIACDGSQRQCEAADRVIKAAAPVIEQNKRDARAKLEEARKALLDAVPQTTEPKQQ